MSIISWQGSWQNVTTCQTTYLTTFTTTHRTTTYTTYTTTYAKAVTETTTYPTTSIETLALYSDPMGLGWGYTPVWVGYTYRTYVWTVTRTATVTRTVGETRTRALVVTSIGLFTSLIQTMVTQSVAPSIVGMLVLVLGVGVGACALLFFMKRVRHPSQTTRPSTPTVRQESVTKTKYCPECGFNMPLDAKHCPKCGAEQYYYGK